jgi:hypothetical protein
MMTPGLRALKRRHPARKVYFAIPQSFHPVFMNNPDVSLLGIECQKLDVEGFAKWHNLTRCPAARVESRSAPRVKQGRIELFAQGMGVSRSELDQHGRRPSYAVSVEEASCGSATRSSDQTRRSCTSPGRLPFRRCSSPGLFIARQRVHDSAARRARCSARAGAPAQGFARPATSPSGSRWLTTPSGSSCGPPLDSAPRIVSDH